MRPSDSTCSECGAFDSFTAAPKGTSLVCVGCGFIVTPSAELSPASRQDSNFTGKGGGPVTSDAPPGLYAPHGKTQTSPCQVPPGAKVTDCGGPLKVGKAFSVRSGGRCCRHGCGHLLSMHDEGGCALAECSCHEAVAVPARSLGVEVKGSCAGEGCACGDLPAMFVHAIELENLTGLASLKMSAYARTASDGRTTLVLRVGVLS